MRRLNRRTRVIVVVATVTALLAGCDWTTYRGGPAHSGSVGEHVLDVDNVGGLEPAWSISGNGGAPVIAGGFLYTVAGSRIEAHDAGGVDSCSGSPKVCEPLWTAELLTGTFTSLSSPSVADGVLYISRWDGGGSSLLFAFDAAGVTNCQGTPATCEPLWSANSRSRLTPTVAGGVVYTVGWSFLGGDVLMAFDAAGVERCSGSPKVCLPLWRADPEYPADFGVPTVAFGHVFVAAQDRSVRVFDAAGVDGCGGIPKTCQPLKVLVTGLGSAGTLSVPALGAGGLFITNGATLLAFDADGDEGCTAGSPSTCAPLWSASVSELGARPPAITGGVVYASRSTVPGQAKLLVGFDADGTTGCSGTPKVCEPIWTTDPETLQPVDGSSVSAPIVANGLVYATGDVNSCNFGCGDIEDHVMAWDANGVEGCSGSPVQCEPLLDWTLDHQNAENFPILVDPVLANGTLYVKLQTGTLTAFTLP